VKRAVLVLVLATASQLASADEVDPRLVNSSIIYARGTALYKADARGKGEVELAQLPTKASIRAMRTSSDGKVLLVDLGGKWSWMPLDGTAKALTELACGDGPAQLATDGACVLCRSATSADKSVIVHLASAKVTPCASNSNATMSVISIHWRTFLTGNWSNLRSSCRQSSAFSAALVLIRKM